MKPRTILISGIILLAYEPNIGVPVYVFNIERGDFIVKKYIICL
jgi:hypothetical protein